MIPFMTMLHVGNQRLLKHFGLVYGEVLRAECGRDVFIDMLSACGMCTGHKELNEFEAQYAKAADRILEGHLLKNSNLQLTVIIDNAILTVPHSCQTADRSSSAQIDATVVIALLHPRRTDLSSKLPRFICVEPGAEAYSFSFPELESGVRSCVGSLVLPTLVEGVERRDDFRGESGDFYVVKVQDGGSPSGLVCMRLEKTTDAIKACPEWGMPSDVRVPLSPEAGSLFEYNLFDAPRPTTGTLYGNAAHERMTRAELCD
ncbi:hypothetical protein M885DRAFT_501055 [Pelagophyceae sp. CCMP2097]|nr:hypothetical protein M885DRAFT_501055 [Pelagophyceae sp. CCMP2097]